MAYFDETNFYLAPSTSSESDAYPFWCQTSVAEETSTVQGNHTFANGSELGGQPDPMVGWPTDYQTEATFGTYHLNLQACQYLTRESPEPVPSVTSHAAPGYGYNQPPYPGHHWPAINSHNSSVAGWDGSFGTAAALEAPTAIPTPSSCKYPFFL